MGCTGWTGWCVDFWFDVDDGEEEKESSPLSVVEEESDARGEIRYIVG